MALGGELDGKLNADDVGDGIPGLITGSSDKSTDLSLTLPVMLDRNARAGGISVYFLCKTPPSIPAMGQSTHRLKI
jgi:hypothetical protein